jgi:hypothetical protein
MAAKRCPTCPHVDETPENTATFHRHPCHDRPEILCVGHLEGEAKCTKQVEKCRTLYVAGQNTKGVKDVS